MRRKLIALVLGIAAMVFSASPASATSGRMFSGGPGMSDYCLATQEPVVFVFSQCGKENYPDQKWSQVYWAEKGGYQIRSLYRDGCLAAHEDGTVFTIAAPCGGYADQFWRPFDGQWGMWENVFHAGRCLAAHADGKVFLAPCTKEWTDQHWFMNS
ncbi:RICIN domain-containing protein [Kibdelosporangium philippinense]|uniref:RICIN domain-containing protein n=1 Tax=Kibdelosporangium philippinense TaxID=211113 RepID=A0ABS8ZLC1_9PSEU|nr:ricin-type beta-trefoil lectin domain protein [Kibdelosporangium philippinense]MCE7008603.1 RICIN domain-containing protein [Kibdelosporangium philippinense]